MLISLILFTCVYVCLVYLVFQLRPLSAVGALVLAFPSLICLESILLNALSLFHAVTRAWMISVHVLFCVVATVHAYKNRAVLAALSRRLSNRARLVFGSGSPGVVLLLPLLLIIGLTTFLYVPNTYDSLTYHMARVAHWIQNGSVGYYTTHIARQNQMGPGAEYLILFFQIISKSDRLANAIQFLSFLLIPACLFSLQRAMRIDRKIIPWITLVCMTAPMAVLQASSTQNDLVDSLIALCIIMMGSRLLVGNAERMRGNDIILAALCCSAGFLVKPISLIVAFPFILAGCLVQAKRILRLLQRPAIRYGLLVSLLFVAIICGPDVVRKAGQGVFSRPEVYPLLSEWDLSRLFNPLAMVAPNFPFPKLFHDFIRDLGIPLVLYDQNVFNIHEDFIGNPVQLLLLLLPGLAAPILLLFKLGSSSRQRLLLLLLAVLPLLSWCAFGWVVRNQGWITRLQLPLFFLLPFSLALLFSRSLGYSHRKIYCFVFTAIVLFSYAYGLKVVSMNPSRPLDARFFWGDTPSAFENYYRMADKKKEHNNFLRVAEELNCRRAYLLVIPDYPEYPLTWRAMQAGMQIRHAVREDVDSWPCMLFADGVKTAYVPDRGVRWVSMGESHTLVRNLEYEFDQSAMVVSKVERWEKTLGIEHDRGETDLDYQSGQLLIGAKNKDPYIIVPGLGQNLGRECILKVVMHSPVKTVFKLYYQTRERMAYSEENVFWKKMEPGENVLYFQLPGDEIIGSLRLDPGEDPATYTVRSIEVRRITRK